MTPQDRAQMQSLISAEKWDEARKLLGQLGEQDDVVALSFRAEIESGEGDQEAAAATYDEILERWPDDATALYNASVVYSDLERHEDAMVSLESVIEIEGESAAVLNDLAYEYIEAGHNVPGSLAAARAEALADDEGQRCRARLNVATALANMGRKSDARRRLEDTLRDCTGECGEREAMEDLARELEAGEAGVASSSKSAR